MQHHSCFSCVPRYAHISLQWPTHTYLLLLQRKHIASTHFTHPHTSLNYTLEPILLSIIQIDAFKGRVGTTSFLSSPQHLSTSPIHIIIIPVPYLIFHCQNLKPYKINEILASPVLNSHNKCCKFLFTWTDKVLWKLDCNFPQEELDSPFSRKYVTHMHKVYSVHLPYSPSNVPAVALASVLV